MNRRMRPCLMALVAATILLGSAPGRAASVDLALVLAVDVSGSIDTERFNLQRNGYAAAFSNRFVIDAIAAGAHGAIMATFVEWSGPGPQHHKIGWRLIKDAGAAAGFGKAIAQPSRAYADWTSISGALDFARGLLDRSDFVADR